MHRGLSAGKRNERWLTGCRSALVRPAGVMAIYNEFYGFAEQPFNITPDPRFLFYSQRHREALNHMLFGVEERKGFIQVTGEVGAGKTTLCRAFLQGLGNAVTTGLIFNPCLTGYQLIRTILSEFGLKAPGNDRVRALEVLNEFLLAEFQTGRGVVLMIDEAQDLSPELLEQVRLLSNLETDQHKLLQIVLLGQPELRKILARPKLRQLQQRITVRYHLDALSASETENYVFHRLHVAGVDSRDVFSSWALRRIHSYSGGIPRLINVVCDKALLAGYVGGESQLTTRHVRQAVRELGGRLE